MVFLTNKSLWENSLQKLDNGYHVTLLKHTRQYFVNDILVRSYDQPKKKFWGTKHTKFGEALHKNIHEFLCGMHVLRGTEKMGRFLKQFLYWYEEYKPKTIATEQMLYTRIGHYCGTVDYICRIGGVIHVIDWKTSHIEGFNDDTKIPAQKRHAGQMYMYKKLIEANYIGFKYNEVKYCNVYLSDSNFSFRRIDFNTAFQRKSKKRIKTLDRHIVC